VVDCDMGKDFDMNLGFIPSHCSSDGGSSAESQSRRQAKALLELAASQCYLSCAYGLISSN